MNLFCTGGGFHKYEYYYGPCSDGFNIECNRCIKCGKIFGSNDVISNDFVYSERKRRKEYIDKMLQETKDAIGNTNHNSETAQFQNIIIFSTKRKNKK